MNILCIGNSFSVDGTRYLHQIAKADGEIIEVVNFQIGGCPLDKHYRNMISGKPEYDFFFNGFYTGFKLALDDALLSRKWDYITIQQLSSLAPDYESYQPYLDALVDYIRECTPKAKLLLQQTWAYEEGSKRLTDELGYKTQEDMFKDIENAYEQAKINCSIDGIIPSGAAFQELYKAGIGPIHRDTFHASLGIGRYTLGLIWYRYLTGADVTNNTFCDFDEEIDAETVKKIKECVMKTKI